MDAQHRHLLKISLLANSFEWYEYSIFGFLAGLMGHLFCDATHPITGLIQGWCLFATSYFARPLGAVGFGLLGNRLGHGHALKFSLLLMAIPTMCIGLLPTYTQAGWVGLYLLVALRLVQGFAAGGELPNSGLYIFETAALQYRSLLCSTLSASGPIGMLFSSLVTALLARYFTQTDIIQWAWRIPFLLSIPLTVCIGYIRYTILETSPALVIQRKPTQGLSSLALPLLKAFALISFESVGFYLLFVWMPTYYHYFLGIPQDIAHFTHFIAVVLSIIFCFMGGYIAQRFGYTQLVLIGTISVLALSLPIFQALQVSRHWYSLFALQSTLILAWAPLQSTFAETLIRLFPKNVRSLGASLAWSIPAAYIGSTTPLVCTYMIHKTGLLCFPALYLMAFGCLALPIVLTLKQSSSPT